MSKEEDSVPEEQEWLKKITRSFWWGVAGAAAFCLIYWIVVYFVTRWGLAHQDDCGLCVRESWAQAGTFGDSFGALNTLFSGIAIAGVLATFWMQRGELNRASAQADKRDKQYTQQVQAMVFQALYGALPSHIAEEKKARLEAKKAVPFNDFKKAARALVDSANKAFVRDLSDASVKDTAVNDFVGKLATLRKHIRNDDYKTWISVYREWFHIVKDILDDEESIAIFEKKLAKDLADDELEVLWWCLLRNANLNERLVEIEHPLPINSLLLAGYWRNVEDENRDRIKYLIAKSLRGEWGQYEQARELIMAVQKMLEKGKTAPQEKLRPQPAPEKKSLWRSCVDWFGHISKLSIVGSIGFILLLVVIFLIFKQPGNEWVVIAGASQALVVVAAVIQFVLMGQMGKEKDKPSASSNAAAVPPAPEAQAVETASAPENRPEGDAAVTAEPKETTTPSQEHE